MDDQDYLDAKEALDLARQHPPLVYNLTSASELNVFQVSADLSESEVSTVADPVYEQFLSDVWVGVVLTLMVISCVCFMCTCLVYHKIQEWKSRSLQNRNSDAGLENGLSELPSYTIASGLPTYDEALEQLKKFQPSHEISPGTRQNSLASKHTVGEENFNERRVSIMRCDSKTHSKSLALSSGSSCQNSTSSNSLPVFGWLYISKNSRKSLRTT